MNYSLHSLEVILADFVRLEQETSSTEAEAQSAFDKFSADSTADIDAKTSTSKEKEALKLSKTRDLEDTGKDLKSTQKELDAALAYHDELKPSCLDLSLGYTGTCCVCTSIPVTRHSEGPFLAVSKLNFATKCSFCRTFLEINHFEKFAKLD